MLSDIDILVVPSIWYENSPLVIQEAFAAGIPVMASNLGGMAEAIRDEVDGLLFERGDVEDLAGKLRRFAQEPELLNQLKMGIPSVKSIETEVEELEKIYYELIPNVE